MPEEQQQTNNHEMEILSEDFCRIFNETKKSEAKDLFNKISAEYQSSDRIYHTLSHVQKMLDFLEICKSKIKNWNAIFLAVWFHDVIYDPKAQDNEEQSALYTEEHLRQLDVSEELISQIVSLILATKKHEPIADNSDSEFLLDGDLAILGSDESDYDEYARKIRREYFWFSDEQYREGRKKVLEGFLKRPRLFLTENAYKELEQRARRNIEREISGLN
jgi:predicted metal-dependent HD superfamily phosphohydrolase